MPALVEFEVEYLGGPKSPRLCGGVDFSKPYNTLEPNYLAPGSVNTSNTAGFLTSSPWVGNSPYTTAFAAGEVLLGMFPVYASTFSQVPTSFNFMLLVTSDKVYVSTYNGVSQTGTQITPGTLTLL